jgi:glucose/arabinose dehydrogenase
MRSSAIRASAAFIVTAAVSIAAAGCALMPQPTPTETPAPTTAATVQPTPVVSPPAEEPVAVAFDPDSNAQTNLPFVDSALAPLVSPPTIPPGEQIVAALVGVGAPIETLQVTPDTTAIGLAVDAVLFSVRLGNECILGQFDDDGYFSTTAPVLNSGACLIGTTVSLD